MGVVGVEAGVEVVAWGVEVEAGVEVVVWGTVDVPAVTVTSTSAETLGLAALVTVTVQLPAATPVIRPIASTVATLLSEEVQISLLSGASSGIIVTRGIWVSPTVKRSS